MCIGVWMIWRVGIGDKRFLDCGCQGNFWLVRRSILADVYNTLISVLTLPTISKDGRKKSLCSYFGTPRLYQSFECGESMTCEKFSRKVMIIGDSWGCPLQNTRGQRRHLQYTASPCGMKLFSQWKPSCQTSAPHTRVQKAPCSPPFLDFSVCVLWKGFERSSLKEMLKAETRGRISSLQVAPQYMWRYVYRLTGRQTA